jgi:hypothetical protein
MPPGRELGRCLRAEHHVGVLGPVAGGDPGDVLPTAGVTGAHTVHLTFAGDGKDDFTNVNWFTFDH